MENETTISLRMMGENVDLKKSKIYNYSKVLFTVCTRAPEITNSTVVQTYTHTSFNLK